MIDGDIRRYYEQGRERERLTSGGGTLELDEPDASFDAALLFGPLYHLTERAERIAALAEARRVLRPGGLALVVAISRFASLLDGLCQGILGGPEAAQLIERTLRSGQHRNPGLERYRGWFTTSFFPHLAELAAEIAESGLILEALIGIEGPGGFVGNGWDDPHQRPHILRAARAVEHEASLLGLSGHLLAVARTSR